MSLIKLRIEITASAFLGVVNNVNYVIANCYTAQVYVKERENHGMMNTLKLLLSRQLKGSKMTHKNGGFTLIELLVAMVLATLVITPLLGFMINIMDSDRKEQVKANSEQELQVALEYIARDLEQAVYIYDDEGVTRNNSTNAITSGIKDQIPPVAPADGCNNANECQPVLVFWKREYKEDVVPLINTSSCTNSTSCSDTFVYSLVGYYLIKDNKAPWSKAARIGRFQIQDGVKAPNSNGTFTYLSTDCTQEIGPSCGFNLFNLSAKGNSLKVKMNQWRKAIANYTAETFVLLDYIDQSTITDNVPVVACPPDTPNYKMRPVLPYTGANSVNDTFKTYSFYACVDSSKTLAQVYLRGNALTRMKEVVVPYSASNSAYFPQANIQIKGRGFLESR